MKESKRKELKKRGRFYRDLLQLVAVGSVTGIFAGAVVTVFSILVREGERLSQNAYAFVRENPVFLPLLSIGLILGAFLLGVLVCFSTVIRGGGVAQAEGASRGIVPLKWWRDLTLMFTSALLSIFMGLSIGAEGPSVLIGSCAGDGVATALKRNSMIKKYQITGGACAGLAVAMNAPLMGMAFAFEEAHKRFTPEVFLCAFTSVVFGMLTRAAVYAALGMQAVNAFGNYLFYELPVRYYLYVVIAGAVCGLGGILFYKSCFLLRRAFKKIRAKDEKTTLLLRVGIVVAIGGVVSLLSAAVMGGGHGLIEGLGSRGGSLAPHLSSVWGLGLVGSIAVILLLKFFITAVNVGGGIPCGTFIPILAIGACLGFLLNLLFVEWGMEEKYCDFLLMICMAAFFTAVVRAPLTSIVMICELTGSFAPLLPVIIAVAVSYLIGETSKTDGIYEELLLHYEKEQGLREEAITEVYTLRIVEGAFADGRTVREVIWPKGAWVKEIHRGEEVILPDGGTILHEGDCLLITCKTTSPQALKAELQHIVE